MKIVSWLRARIPKREDPVAIQIPAGPEYLVHFDIEVDTVSEKTEVADVSTESELRESAAVPLEPMFLIIDYCDANANITRRRITTRTLTPRRDTICLTAMCHERKAIRTFRMDRIQGVIDDDGVIESAGKYFEDLLGDEFANLRSAISDKRPERVVHTTTASPYTLLRRQINPAIVVLVAAARTDHDFHPEEADMIMQYTENEAGHLLTEGVIAACPGIDGYERLGRLILRTRPSLEDMDEAFSTIATWPARRVTRLAKALFAVVQADGTIKKEENAFVYEFLAFFGSDGLDLY